MDEAGGGLMATTEDDAFPPLRPLLQEPLDERDEATATRIRAVQLLGSMDDLHIAVGRKERLLFRLGQGHPSNGRRFALLRPIVIGALLTGIGGGAMASVALTEWPAWMVRTYRHAVPRRWESVPSPPAVPARRIGLKATGIDPASDPTPAPRSPAGVPRSPVEIRARRPAAEAPSHGAILLVRATRALRVENTPARARALARRYLELQPHGTLADEALAICIEAAADHGDPDVGALAARYLATFPHGPFRRLAERALSYGAE
jgi:hypothetical protein